MGHLSGQTHQVTPIAIQGQAFTDKVRIIADGPTSDGRVVALLHDQVLGQEIVLQLDEGTDVVSAERVVQVEADAVVVVEAQVGLPRHLALKRLVR